MLKDYIENAIKDFDKIPADRKDQLKKIALYVQSELKAEKNQENIKANQRRADKTCRCINKLGQ